MRKIVESRESTIQDATQAALMFLEGAVLKHDNRYYKASKTQFIEVRECFGNNVYVNWHTVHDVDLLRLFNHCERTLYEEIELEWFDNIPKKGVLCKVWNSHMPESQFIEPKIRIIHSYNPNKEYSFIPNPNKDEAYKYAMPLTINELKEYIYDNQTAS